MRQPVTAQYRLVILAALFVTLFCNGTFFAKLFHAFPLHDVATAAFVGAVGIVLFLTYVLVFTLFAGKRTTKPILIGSLLIAAPCGYFMSAYGVFIDSTMLQNVAQTDPSEVRGLMNLDFILRVVLIGILPAIAVWKWKMPVGGFRQEAVAKLSVLALTLVAASLLLVAFSANFSSFFREYKSIRYYTNPAYVLYSSGKFLHDAFQSNERPAKKEEVSGDAQIVDLDFDDEHGRPDRELVLLVVGESARADRFQLNGYARETNPNLSKEKNVVSFTNVESCGTTTAVSVPCMFSSFDRKDFDSEDIYTHENALDVLKREGVNVLWLDNNSSSKGVADHVEYRGFHSAKTNKICDVECRDEGMLVDLQTYIDKHPKGDILIVLHQLGSHGPEYYKRYPESFEYFKPSCKTNKLGECTQEELNNAYDNTIRYTDYFISQAINFIKKNDSRFEASLFYISDHGESLGENGVYLHGMPFMIAPKEQKHTAAILWTGANSDIQPGRTRKQKDQPYSHDNLYCTLLAMFEVETKECAAGKSMFILEAH